MAAQKLETVDPLEWSELYLARGSEEVVSTRPVFTGDVFKQEDRFVTVLQHPCALRADGVHLLPRVLVAPVERFGKLPESWEGHTKMCFFPHLEGGKSPHFSALFKSMDLVGSDQLTADNRVACLSLRGVNVLLQRWVHHNSRAVIDTYVINDVVVGPYEEADIAQEWCQRRSEALESNEAALKECHSWLRQPNTAGGPSRQDCLEDAQQRSGVRRAALQELRRLEQGSGQ